MLRDLHVLQRDNKLFIKQRQRGLKLGNILDEAHILNS
jgi:hypothetical protein